MKCAKCGNDLPPQEGVGRPRKFCGAVCLKLATMEIRRLDALIAALEKRESDLRISGRSRYVAVVRDEINVLEARLAQLVTSPENDSAAQASAQINQSNNRKGSHENH